MSPDRAVRLDNPLLVRWEYASEERLATRNAIYRDLIEGKNAEQLAFEAVAEVRPARVLEVGCGTGEFAERVDHELSAEVVAIDLSERMVELARGRGVDARVGDVQKLPFRDGEFDCVIAGWVLYHVPDLERGIGEIARVLRSSGRLVAGTVGEGNLSELWQLLGGAPTPEISFGSHNGAERLAERFATVERRDAEGTVVFPDHEAVRRFVAATITRAHLATKVPRLDGPFRARSFHVVFIAEKA